MTDLTQIIQLLAATGAGSIITALVNKITTLRRDKQQLKESQHKYLEQINQDLNAVIAKLQQISCYAPKCPHRINAPDPDTTTDNPTQ